MTAVTDVDLSTCYNMSLKDFEHSGVHDIFKVNLKKIFFYLYIYIYLVFVNNVDICSCLVLTKF